MLSLNCIIFIILTSNCFIPNIVIESAPLSRTEMPQEVTDIPIETKPPRLEDALADGERQVAENRRAGIKFLRQQQAVVGGAELFKTSREPYLTPAPVFGKPDNIELTIPLPKSRTDKYGNVIINPWAVSFGDLFRDTRYNIGGKFTVFRMKLDSKMAYNYVPQKDSLSTVCMARTSPYNVPPVMNWLTGYHYTAIRDRNIMMELRKTIFKEGKSLQCHTKEYPSFVPYINCALLRHMRMESLIPDYPKHQLIPDLYTPTW